MYSTWQFDADAEYIDILTSLQFACSCPSDAEENAAL
jgi:hypothetical protein